MQEHFRRRRLPHWDKPGAIYFVTACLEDSLPARGLVDLHRLRDRLARQNPPQGLNEHEWRVRQWKQTFARCDQWLDHHPAVRHLADARLAEEVVKSLLFFAGERYALWSYVVMPSHVHFVFEPLSAWVESLGPSADERTPRERVMHSVKRHSARQCNAILNRRGKFWQEESYDHCVADIDELERVIEYVERNPVTGNLVERPEAWPFSSAWYRSERGLAFGRPVIGHSALRRDGVGV